MPKISLTNSTSPSKTSKTLQAQLLPPTAVKAKKINAKTRKNQPKTSKVKKLHRGTSKGSSTADRSFFSTSDNSNLSNISSIPREITMDGKNNGEFCTVTEFNNDQQQSQALDDLSFQSIHYGDTFAEWVQDEVEGKIRPPRRRLNTMKESMNVDDLL